MMQIPLSQSVSLWLAACNWLPFHYVLYHGIIDLVRIRLVNKHPQIEERHRSYVCLQLDGLHKLGTQSLQRKTSLNSLWPYMALEEVSDSNPIMNQEPTSLHEDKHTSISN